MIETAVHLVLAGTVADRATRQGIEDDLCDEYQQRRARQGWLAAEGWVAIQLVLSFPDFAGLTGAGRMPLMPQAAGRFYGVLLLVIAGGAVVGELALRVSPAGGVVPGLLALSTSLLAAALAGYLLATLAAGAPLVAALGPGLVAAAVMTGALALGLTTPPAWYLVMGALLFPPAAFAGGLWRTRQRLADSPEGENSSC